MDNYELERALLKGANLGPRPPRSADDGFRRQLGWYVHNCASSAASTSLISILIERLPRLKGEEDGEDVCELSKAERRRAFRQLKGIVAEFASPPHDEPLSHNVTFAAEEFGFDHLEREILLLALRYGTNDDVERLADEVGTKLGSPVKAIASLLGAAEYDVIARLSPSGALCNSGVAAIESEAAGGPYIAGPQGYIRIFSRFRKTMFSCFTSREAWIAALLGTPLQPSLMWDDFAHLGEARDLAARLLAGAANERAKGINVLLRGPVGTGKTEFAKALASRAGLSVWAVGETDDEGGEPSRNERLASLRLFMRLLGRRTHTLILFDEAEDLLDGVFSGTGPWTRRRHLGSKVHVNRALERNPIPIIWTCNDTDGIDQAALRRMTVAIEVKVPNREVRERMWRRAARDSGAKLDDGVLRAFATEYTAPPAVAANAVRAMVLANGAADDARVALEGVLRLLGVPTNPKSPENNFDPAFINCGEDLRALVANLTKPGVPRNWALCIHGAPGTGKSRFARYIAHQLGIEVIEKRTSDLFSCWIGETEKAIAALFLQAREQGAMLIFDEADSLLRDRRGALRSWEITQVNEMLTWMETHSAPVVCTTNLFEALDPATLRRFTFKLRFETMTPVQAGSAFERFFQIPSPRNLPEGLSPGDFANVRRRRMFYPAADAAQLAEWLFDEVEAKGLRIRGPGFAIG